MLKLAPFFPVARNSSKYVQLASLSSRLTIPFATCTSKPFLLSQPPVQNFSSNLVQNKQAKTTTTTTTTNLEEKIPTGLEHPLLFDSCAKFFEFIGKERKARTGIILRNFIHSKKYRDSIIPFYYLGVDCKHHPDIRVNITKHTISYLLSIFVHTHFATSVEQNSAGVVPQGHFVPSKTEVMLFLSRQSVHGKEGSDSLIFKISKMIEFRNVSEVAVEVLRPRLDFFGSQQKENQMVNPHLTIEDVFEHFKKLNKIQRGYVQKRNEHWARKREVTKEFYDEIQKFLELLVTEEEVRMYFNILYYAKVSRVTKAMFFKALAQEFYASPRYNPGKELSQQDVFGLVCKLVATKENFEQIMQVLYNENLKEAMNKYCYEKTDSKETKEVQTPKLYQHCVITKPKKYSFEAFDRLRSRFKDTYLIQHFTNGPFFQIYYDQEEGIVLSQGHVDLVVSKEYGSRLYEIFEEWLASLPQKPTSFLLFGQIDLQNSKYTYLRVLNWLEEEIKAAKFYIVDIFHYNGVELNKLSLEERLQQLKQNFTWNDKVSMMPLYGKISGEHSQQLKETIENLLVQPNQNSIALRSCSENLFEYKSFNFNYKDYVYIVRNPTYFYLNVVVLGMTISKSVKTFLLGVWNEETKQYESIGVMYKGFTDQNKIRLLEMLFNEVTPENLPLENYDLIHSTIYNTSFWFKPTVVLQVRGVLRFMKKNSCCHAFVEEHVDDPKMKKVASKFSQCTGLGMSNPTFTQLVGNFSDEKEVLSAVSTSQQAFDLFWQGNNLEQELFGEDVEVDVENSSDSNSDEEQTTSDDEENEATSSDDEVEKNL